jgi:replication factor A1
MNFDDIIQRILLSRKELARDELLRMIEEKKGTAKAYLTDEVAARIVAMELEVKIPGLEPFQPHVLIKDLISGLNDATVIGRVVTMYPVRTFTRPQDTQGRLLRLVIADKSATLRVVLWDDKTSLAEAGRIQRGQIIKVSHGYVREGLDGKLELNMGTRSEIQVSPSKIVDSEYPPITQFMQKIAEITGKHKEASVLGIVQSVDPMSEFERSDGTGGKVRRLHLRDETGQITVVFWNEKVDQLGEAKKDDYLQILNATVKEQLDGRIELHAGERAQIEALAEAPPSLKHDFSAQLTKIQELKPNMRNLRVLARAIYTGEVREFRRSSNEKGQVSTLLIGDETGTTSLNLWGEKASIAGSIHPRDIILAEAAYTRERSGSVTLNIGRRGNLVLNPKSVKGKKIPPHKEVTFKIVELKEGGPFTVRGTVAEPPTIREVVTARGEKVTVASFKLTDETGTIEVSVWRKLVDSVKDLTVGTQIEIKNAYAKRGFGGQLRLTTRRFTSVNIPSESQEAAT